MSLTPRSASKVFLILLIVLILLVLPLGLGGMWIRGHGSKNEDFLKEAATAFKDGKDDEGSAFLSAVLLDEPAHQKALDLYQEHLEKKFNKALEDNDWELAQIQVAGYDAAVRAGLKGVKSASEVQDLMTRQQVLTQWENQWREARDKVALNEVGYTKGQLDKPQSAPLADLESRLRKLPIDVLSQDVRKEIADIAIRLRDRQNQETLSELGGELTKLIEEAKKPERLANDLREITVRGQHLRSRLVEAKLEGADVTGLQAGCDGLLAELDQRLQVLSVRQMQQIADADAIAALKKVEALLKEIDNKYKEVNFQWCGERLAEAELLLNRIDRLCSQPMQDQALKDQEEVRKRALRYRIKQQGNYNIWAIGVLEEAIREHNGATPWYWRNDRGKLKEIISDRLGEIDPQHLHPVTHALFTEMFQKILSDLKDNDLKVEVTRNVEMKEKKRLSDF